MSLELQKYFSSKSWYNGIYEPEAFPVSVFNDFERYNSARINELESQRAGSDMGYPLDSPGYDINAVGTASYARPEGNDTTGLYTDESGEVAVG